MDDVEIISSSDLRKTISSYLEKVATTRQAIHIESHGLIVAQLTLDRGDHQIPPLPLVTSELRGSWGKVIEAVAVRKARYVFMVKAGRKDSTKVYLRPYSMKFSRFIRDWNEHVREHRAQETESDVLAAARELENTVLERVAELERLIAELSQQTKIVFARMERTDLYKCPELGTEPLASRADLERFEAD